MRSRYSSVQTRDGMHYLIPNEELITKQVINWSFSEPAVRLRAPVGVAYDTDLRLAMRLMEEAALAQPRVLVSPEPATRILGFGDSAVDLELRFWIADPHKGVVNIRSDIYLAIWDAFHAHGVVFPFPQRDVRLDLTQAAQDLLAPPGPKRDL